LAGNNATGKPVGVWFNEAITAQSTFLRMIDYDPHHSEVTYARCTQRLPHRDRCPLFSLAG
jgi:hypothetical protein